MQGYFIQSYGQGYISRDGDKYHYVVGEEVVGTYDSVDALVKAKPTSDGKQADTSTSVATESTDNVDSKATAKKSKK